MTRNPRAWHKFLPTMQDLDGWHILLVVLLCIARTLNLPGGTFDLQDLKIMMFSVHTHVASCHQLEFLI